MRLKEYINASKYAEILRMTQLELAFCISYFILALIICFYSTPGGSLFSPDSTAYARDATNFLSYFPNYYAGPIYPALIAIVMGLGFTSEQGAGLVPIISYSLLGFPLYLIGKIISRPMAGYVTCVISLLCGKYLLYISTYAWTDMPYLFFSAIVILFISIYNKCGILSSIAFAGLFASLSIYTRIIGIALIPVGIIVIVLNKKGFKNSLVALVYYCFIPIALTIARIIITIRRGDIWLYDPSNSRSSNLPLYLNVNLFMKYTNRVIYDDYKDIALIIFILVFLIIIYISLNRQIFIFIKNTIQITSYILLYSIAVILSTANTPISISVAGFDFRYVVPIFPYIALLVVLLYIYAYDNILNRLYKSIFKAISMVLLICLIAQGANELYYSAHDIRLKSIANYIDREGLNRYMLEYNLTSDNIYIDRSIEWANLEMELDSHQIQHQYKLINNNIPGKTIFNNLTSDSYTDARNLAELIERNKDIPTYIIVSNRVAHVYMLNPSRDFCLSNPYKLSKSIIFRASVSNDNESCNSNVYPESHIIGKNDYIIKSPLTGSFMSTKHMGKKYDQLLLLSSNLGDTKKDEYSLQIIDFVNGSSSKYPYPKMPGTTQSIGARSDTILTGDFMGLGYDQALFIEYDPKGDKIVVEDFNQEKSPAIIRYSEVLSNNSTLRDLIDSEDEQLAGDFLGRGHSQVLFIDRNPDTRRLVIADLSKGNLEISLIKDDSALIAPWLDYDDIQLAGDFMGLGRSQLLFINRNHTKEERAKISIVDFGDGKDLVSIRCQENWGDSGRFGGWLDANDTQLVGDFMHLGHSQVFFVNHDHKGGKIMIIDFSKGITSGIRAGIYWENWNDGGTIFESWLDLNDTKVAGDFKGLGYSQVAFLSSSINGLNATIVDFPDPYISNQ